MIFTKIRVSQSNFNIKTEITNNNQKVIQAGGKLVYL